MSLPSSLCSVLTGDVGLLLLPAIKLEANYQRGAVLRFFLKQISRPLNPA